MRKLLFLLLLIAPAAYADCVFKADTAKTIPIGPFLDSTDGITAETALTISQADVLLWKEGGTTFAQKTEATACTHRSNGFYTCPFDTTDTNTEGTLTISVAETGAVPVWHECQVLAADFYDARYGATALVTAADVGLLFKSTIATVNTQTSFDMDDSIAVDDTWIGNEVTIEDADNATTSQTKYVNDVDAANSRIIIDSDPGFTVATTDIVRVYAKRHPAFDVFAQLGVYDAATSDYVLALAQLQARSDAAIKADRSTELAELNADQDSGAGTYDNETDSQEASDADRVTAQAGLDLLTGTDGATLATSQPNYAPATAAQATTLDGKLDTIDDFLDTEIAAILADTNELQTDDIPGRLDDIEGATFDTSTDSLEAIRNRGDAAWTTGGGGSAPTVEDIRTEIDANSTQLAAIVADTNELQTDWVDDGRLDLILDAKASQSSVDTIDDIVDDILVDTAVIGTAGAGLTEAGGTGDHLTALATAAALATVDTEVGVIDGIVDDILLDTAEIANLNDFDPTNDTVASVTAVGSLTGHTPQTGDSFARIGAAGAGLTAVPWNAAWDVEVQSEAADALAALTIAEPTAPPAWDDPLADWIAWIGAWSQNEINQTATTKTLRNEADDADIATCGVSDDGTTFTKAACQ
jgi:hypothetical protein